MPPRGGLSETARKVAEAYKPISERGLAKAIKDGRVPPNPTVEQAIYGLAHNTNPVNGGSRKPLTRADQLRASRLAAEIKEKVKALDGHSRPVHTGLLDLSRIDKMSLVELREKREAVALQLEAIELMKAQKSVVSVDEIAAEMQKIWRALRDQLMGMSQKLAPQLASMNDASAVALMMDDYMRRCLTDAHQKLAKAGELESS